MNYEIMTVAILTLLGLCLGSFVNALVWRLYEQSSIVNRQSKRRDKRQETKEFSILSGRSMCVHCKHRLAAKDLIPVFSWLVLRGKCRYCHKPISWQYPAVELLTAGLFVLSYLKWPYGFETSGIVLFAAWLPLLSGLIALAVYDIKWMLLPDRLVYPLSVFWLAVVAERALLARDPQVIATAFWGVVFCGGLFWLLFQVSRGRWIGGGDVKLGVLLGLLVGGPMNALLVIFLASWLGTLVALPLMISGRAHRATRLPFGPYLITASVIVFLWGGQLTQYWRDLLMG